MASWRISQSRLPLIGALLLLSYLVAKQQGSWTQSCRRYGPSRWGGMVRKTVDKEGISPTGKAKTPLAEIDPEVQLDKESFEQLLIKIDSGLRALPATAQVVQSVAVLLPSLLESQCLCDIEREAACFHDLVFCPCRSRFRILSSRWLHFTLGL